MLSSMSSLRRINASRANGRQPRGPVTPEGKKRSSQNAMQHGLLSDCIVLPGESLEGFQAVLASHFERPMPVDGVERAMFEDSNPAWTSRRLHLFPRPVRRKSQPLPKRHSPHHPPCDSRILGSQNSSTIPVLPFSSKPRLRYSPGLAPTTRLNALLNAASDS